MKQYIYPSFKKNKQSNAVLLNTDYLLLFAFLVVPTSFFCFVHHNVFYVAGLMDYNFLAVLLAIPLVFLGQNYFKVFKLAGGKWLVLLCVYIVFNCLYSLHKGIALKEIITIVRFSFIYPIPTLCAVWYLCGVDNDRLYKIVRYIIVLTIIQGFLLMLSSILRIDYFIDKSIQETNSFKEATLVQNLRAFPRFYDMVTVILTGMIFFEKESIRYVVISLCILIPLPFLTMLRSRSSSLVLMLILFFFLYTLFIQNIPGKTGTIVKTVISVLLGIIIFYAAFPNYANRYLEKWGITAKETEIKTGTLDFRMKLVDKAWNKIKKDKSIITGLGYRRDAKKMQYDLVLGTDTYFAPVIYTEGVIGLILRILPIIAIFLANFHRLFINYEPKIKIISIAIVSYILCQVPVIIQSNIFASYNISMFFMYILELLRYNYLEHDEQCIKIV